MVSVTVSKHGKTDLVFLQPGAKINSVYYCENVLKQGLVLAIRRISNDFVFQQDRAPCTPWSFTPHCRLPAFQCAWVHWTRKFPAEQSRSTSQGLFSVDSVVADGVTSQKFRHWSAETSSDRSLLGWAKSGHTEPSDWSAAKKTEDGCQSKGWSCWILSEVTNHKNVLEIVFVLLYLERKLSKTRVSLSNAMQFGGYWRFMQIRRRIFNHTDTKIMHFILDKMLKLLTYYTPFCH